LSHPKFDSRRVPSAPQPRAEPFAETPTRGGFSRVGAGCFFLLRAPRRLVAGALIAAERERREPGRRDAHGARVRDRRALRRWRAPPARRALLRAAEPRRSAQARGDREPLQPSAQVARKEAPPEEPTARERLPRDVFW
jgi:hypothetical protein